MRNLVFIVGLLLISCSGNAQNDGVVEFNIGEDPANANEISVIGGGAGMINIYRYNAYEDADRMPKPFHKDDSLHIWSYRCQGQNANSWILLDERTRGAKATTFTAMKDIWLKFKAYSDWWLDKNGVTGTGKIYQTPSRRGVVVSDDSIKCRTFKVNEVNGDWIKVSYSLAGCAVAEVKTLGWIMWRRKGEVLVNFP